MQVSTYSAAAYRTCPSSTPTPASVTPSRVTLSRISAAPPRSPRNFFPLAAHNFSSKPHTPPSELFRLLLQCSFGQLWQVVIQEQPGRLEVHARGVFAGGLRPGVVQPVGFQEAVADVFRTVGQPRVQEREQRPGRDGVREGRVGVSCASGLALSRFVSMKDGIDESTDLCKEVHLRSWRKGT